LCVAISAIKKNQFDLIIHSHNNLVFGLIMTYVDIPGDCWECADKR